MPSNPVSSGVLLPRPGRISGLLGVFLGCFALAVPFLPGNLGFFALGSLLLVVGLLENFAGFVLRDPAATGTWFSRGEASILTGALLIAMPRLTFTALALLLGLSWMISGLSVFVTAIVSRKDAWTWRIVDGLINFALGLAIALQWPVEGIVSIGLFVGLRYLSAGWAALVGDVALPSGGDDTASQHPDARLGLPSHAYLGQLREQLTHEAGIRESSDRVWRAIFLLTFFCIHAARMDTQWDLVGILSPAGAVVGDIFLAVLAAYGLVAPISVTWRNLTRGLERRAWVWYLARVDEGRTSGLSVPVNGWLKGRMRAALARSEARGSATAAVGWGMQHGLPVAALLIALTPLWGVSWFFNTETWVTGVWELWAEQRTDTWREEMVHGVRTAYDDADSPDFLAIHPEGVAGAKDFSFVVIGDTGEGDASQHILRDQLLHVGQQPLTKFLVVSSDVIYPSGAMKDYEPKFYLPFKGFGKPIYGLPGNHDWYDALEAFTANFFAPQAAQAAMRARREADLNLTTTTEDRIDGLIAEAARLRGEYQVQAGLQRAPYFEMHADQFSLVVVDTGILRKVDEDQYRWLDEALGRAQGKFTMAILGHPLYAAGRYQGEAEDFGLIHQLLRKHGVRIAMAGDTHDFEYYQEPADKTHGPLLHFVNGGGGAYLSIGTALSWPRRPPVDQCGIYPRADRLIERMNAQMPTWKRPLWFWVRSLHAWPSSPEAMAAAFDYDHAPFFQSFMEVRVEGSSNRVRLWLYGSNGRLRWRDLQTHGPIPGGGSNDDLVEFSFPLRRE